MDLLDALKAEGLNVSTYGDWQTDDRPGVFDPIGVMLHHTAGHDDLVVVKNGRTGLRGPLANLWVSKSGHVVIVCDGRANDSGVGSGVVLRELLAGHAPPADAAKRHLPDDTNGNPYFYDIEVENLGDGRDPYPVVQIAAFIGAATAICRWHGWAANRVIHHREWTKRKIDMSWRGDLRGLVASALALPLGGRVADEFDAAEQQQALQALARIDNKCTHIAQLLGDLWSRTTGKPAPPIPDR